MKIAVFYYTQSGQALEVAKSICSPMEEEANGGHCIVYKEIIPVQEYPFPWDEYQFFDTFPETRLGLPPSGIKAMDFSDIEDAGMVIVVGQSWFLSPSLPLQSFFTDEAVRDYLRDRQIVFVNACRNMWLMTNRKVKSYLKEIGADLVGMIVLQDKQPNLISVLTIVRWLINGKKEATRTLPAAGITDEDIAKASIFGKIIGDYVSGLSRSATEVSLQEKLLEAGAIDYKACILALEKTGHRIFGVWARLIRLFGGFRDKRRKPLVFAFYYYLCVILFAVSPFAQLLFYLTYPLHNVAKKKRTDTSVSISIE